MGTRSEHELPANCVTPIGQSERRRVIDRLHAVTALAEKLFDQPLHCLPVHFDLKGLSAGQFCCGPSGLWYRFNPWVFAVDFSLHIEETVTHEVAHYVTHVLHGQRGIRPHGREWRAVMSRLGFPQARARGDYQVTGVPRRRQTRHRYSCRCGPTLLTTTRHNRIREGNRYVCRRCHQTLQYIGE